MTTALFKRTAFVGNEVTFGRYKQDTDSEDMREIQWLVLVRRGKKVLLLSKYGLDAKPYHPDFGRMTWEECDLRQWLNVDFLNTAFTSEEQKAVLLTKVYNGPKQGCYKIFGKNKTEDKVFLLSYKEAFQKYLLDDESRICRPTAYALKRGAYANETGKCFWWLRSPGYNQYCAACVYSDGSRNISRVSSAYNCIRPALWVDLNSDIFRRNTQD